MISPVLSTMPPLTSVTFPVPSPSVAKPWPSHTYPFLGVLPILLAMWYKNITLRGMGVRVGDLLQDYDDPPGRHQAMCSLRFMFYLSVLGHPSICHFTYTTPWGNNTLSSRWELYLSLASSSSPILFLSYTASSSLLVLVIHPCYVIRCVHVDPWARPMPHSGHRSHSLYDSPPPVVFQEYALLRSFLHR